MNVGESKYPHPLITLVAVLVTALALSAIIWAETGWPWRCAIYEVEGTEEAETSSYIEYNGVGVTLANSKYGGFAAENPLTFALTPRYLVFPDGETFRYEVKPGKLVAWDGLPLEALKRFYPDGAEASLYIDEYTPMVLIYHLLPQFVEAGFSGFNFLLDGPDGEIEWRVSTTIGENRNISYCLYWDRRVIQLGSPSGIIEEKSTEEYLFIPEQGFEEVLRPTYNVYLYYIALPGMNTTFGELVTARDAFTEPPIVALGFDDPAVAPFAKVINFNPGLWVYDIQPSEYNSADYYIK